MIQKGIIAMFVLLLIIISYFSYEKITYSFCRKKLKYIIHVNGIRGKSSVTRMIYEGLYNAGYKVYAKTTGTLPMIIDTNRQEKLIKRIGKANIREQIKIVKDAVRDGAKILVIECMAVLPEMQYTTEKNILKANIMALTNVRIDHTDVMGDTIEDIERVLSYSIPSNGVLFTSEEKNIDIIKNTCNKNNTKFIKVDVDSYNDDFDFKENIALATEVCKYVGVNDVDIKNYIRDPYVLTEYKWKNIRFINGFSINDKESTLKVYKKLDIKNPFILLINNRNDRGFRVDEMIDVAKEIEPSMICVYGSNQYYVKSKLKKYNTICMRDVRDIDNIDIKDYIAIFAIGNIANDGLKIIDRIKSEGEKIV